MTKPLDDLAVATMEGRELDAAVCERVFGRPITSLTNGGRYWYTGDDGGYYAVPEYSTELGPAFFAMIAAVREKGWSVDIEAGPVGDGPWIVELACPYGPCEKHGSTRNDWHGVQSTAPTLSLALARAALLTTTSA